MMSKKVPTKVSLPGKLIDLLWVDDEFYRDVVSSKKYNEDKYPKTDQWVDEDGFNIELALAGYSSSDLSINAFEGYLEVESRKANCEKAQLSEPERLAKPKIRYGSIVRGIARRSFKYKMFISSDFDPSKSKAFMNNGLLHIVVPKRVEASVVNIKIKKESRNERIV